jgi:hypothetical protein
MSSLSGDPIDDLLEHGKHPFAADIEALIHKIASIQPAMLDDIREEAIIWAKGDDLDIARARLMKILNDLTTRIGSGLDELDGLGDLLG